MVRADNCWPDVGGTHALALACTESKGAATVRNLREPVTLQLVTFSLRLVRPCSVENSYVY